MSRQDAPLPVANVKARLRLTRKAPALPRRESYLSIWIKGTRFRVREESGREAAKIVGDVLAARGLGEPVRTMEEIMDARSQARAGVAGAVTDMYGDLATNEGWVYRGQEPGWLITAEELAPAARQIFFKEPNRQLEPRGQVTHLGRPATEYHGFVEGEEEGIPYKSEVTQIISPPYLLFCSVRDAKNADHYFTRAVVSLEEGVATDEDVTPP